MMTIGTLARRAATTVETIRWYERIGLLPPPARTTGNYRSYGSENLRRLFFVRRARELGFGIEQIRSLLAMAGEAGRPCGDVDAIARSQLATIEEKIEDLTQLADELRDVISRCGSGTVAECAILDAVGRPSRSSRSKRGRARADLATSC